VSENGLRARRLRAARLLRADFGQKADCSNDQAEQKDLFHGAAPSFPIPSTRGMRRGCDRWLENYRDLMTALCQSALAAMFTVSASSAVLKMNEMMPCAATVWRIGRQVIDTSETCDVMPITKEK
jgi:hypothetical protein